MSVCLCATEPNTLRRCGGEARACTPLVCALPSLCFCCPAHRPKCAGRCMVRLSLPFGTAQSAWRTDRWICARRTRLHLVGWLLMGRRQCRWSALATCWRCFRLGLLLLFLFLPLMLMLMLMLMLLLLLPLPLPLLLPLPLPLPFPLPRSHPGPLPLLRAP